MCNGQQIYIYSGYGMVLNTDNAIAFTHCGRVRHICVSKLTIIGSTNGLSPGVRWTTIWTIAGILLIIPLGTNVSKILIQFHILQLLHSTDIAFMSNVWLMNGVFYRNLKPNRYRRFINIHRWNKATIIRLSRICIVELRWRGSLTETILFIASLPSHMIRWNVGGPT